MPNAIRRPIVAALLLGLPHVAAGQEPRVVVGTVRDSAGVPLGDVVVYAVSDDARESAAAYTSSGGRFRLRMPATTRRIVAARLGFAPETVSVAVSGDALGIALRPSAVALSAAVVQAERALSAASSSVVRQLDVALRPRESSQELLRLVPGLVIAQHAGGGKAEQIFLRGFDADHGTDVSISVDGTPANMPTHAHGQGYADLHFLMPEIVERVDVRKGPYDARDGDFATAGAIAFVTKDRIDAPVVSARSGSFVTQHGLLMLPFGGDASRAGGYVAASAHHTDGPFERAQDYARYNVFAKLTAPVLQDALVVGTASAFGGHWNASGEIPARAVATGLIDRFGSLDRSEGGNTARYDASVALRARTPGASDWEARAWATRYRFQLFSDFTYFLDDAQNGDGIEQHDARTATGVSVRYGRQTSLGSRVASWEIGGAARADVGDVALYHQADRRRLDTRNAARIDQRSIGPWARGTLQLSNRARLELGIRADAYHFDVRDASAPSQTRWQSIVSPKASLAYDLSRGTTLFINAGSGFHSNDARDAVSAPRDATILPRALGSEIGARHSWTGGSVAASLWSMDVASELVWVGDAGTTEASGRTRRVGTDVEARVRLLPRLWGDADVSLARGRYRDEPAGADRIALAPTVTATLGLTVRDAGPFEGGLRLRQVGARAANPDNSVRARGYMLGEIFGNYAIGRARLVATIDNVLDVRWNEAQFATTSRLRGERTAVTELHFTPGAPRSVQLGVEYRFGRGAR
jgi:outer membrane receptor protein involved in Fe transport